jgi:formylglycine-generating enzyme
MPRAIFASSLTICLALSSFAATLIASEPELGRIPFAADEAVRLQRAWADSIAGSVSISNSVGMKLVLIPPGRFTLGPNGSTQRVTLTRPFYLSTTEVTLGQYRKFKPGHSVPAAEAEFNEDNRPAAMISWEECHAYCEWLSSQPEEERHGRVYSLPTDAQWEWAARAGTASTRYFGDDDQRQVDYSWFNHTYTPNPKHESAGRGRQTVGLLPPNAWGLHDMLGNVWEWCEDRRTDERTGETRDPIMRGGSWRSGAFHCTAVAHDPGDPRLRGDHIGFRVACTVVER